MEARARGHQPIVVPRDPQLGEHVDGHQLRFATRIGRTGLVVVARDQHDLATVVDHAVAVGRRPTGASDTAAVVSRRFGDLVSALVQAG
jgi:UDP-N-acetylglucosamine transferase subunit ALG13